MYETFAQGVTAVGRFGGYICVRFRSESSHTGRPDCAVSSIQSELRCIVIAIRDQTE